MVATTELSPVRRVHVIAAALLASGLASVGAAGGEPLPRLARLILAGLIAALVLAALRAPSAGWAGRALRWAALVVLVATATLTATMATRHLTVSGASVRSVGALVGLGAALVLLAAVVARLWRGARRWQRVLAPPVALVLVAFVVYPIAVATHATTQPAAPLGDATPADLGLQYDDVTFETPDDVTLSGWYLPSVDGAAVALLHGASSTRSNVLAHAEVLNRNGYGVLLFDARGHGESGGDPMDLGWYGEADVAGAVTFLAARPDVDPARIGVVGMSMGGEEAIGAAGADDRIAVVVAEGATNRTYADRDDWLPRTLGGWIQRRMEQVTFAVVELVTPIDPPASLRDSAAAAAPRPILLIAGDGEEDAARSIQAGAPGSVTVWESGTGHTRGLADLPEEWEQQVVAFLDAALAP